MSSRAETSDVTMIDLAGRHSEVATDVERRVIQALRGGNYVGGPAVQEAEHACATLLNRSGAVGVNSGTDALMFAMQAVGVRPGDHVIVPALTFFATAGAVHNIGAIPVVVDVGEDGLVDPQAVQRAMTRSVRAVVPVHLFGGAANLPAQPVPCVDDLAQAIGADPAPGCGVIGAVSTYPTKTWGGAGDGGFVVSDDPGLLHTVRLLANHGMTHPHEHHPVCGTVGRNSRLDAIQAAVLLAHADELSARIRRRRQIARRYDRALPNTARPLPRDPGHPVQHYVVRVANRDQVRTSLRDLGVHTAVYYPRGLHRQPALQERAILTECPVTDMLCGQLLALPVHAGLSAAQVDRVVRAVWSSAP